MFAALGERPAPAAPLTGDDAPLSGIRVMDFGHGGVGVGGRMLAEYRADVVKIESRTYPDFIRTVLRVRCRVVRIVESEQAGLGVDAKHPEGRALLKRMAAVSDIAIENNSTGIMEQMGIGYGDLSAENNGLVMMSSQLMGSRGPWAAWSGYQPNRRSPAAWRTCGITGDS